MNTYLRRTFYLITLGFLFLVGMLGYWQVYAQESLANDPSNTIELRQSVQAQRGSILAGDGETALAKSVPRERDGQETVYERTYPEGNPYANIVGYWSTKYGATGIERARDSALSGISEPDTVRDLINQASSGPQPGDNVVLTIDPELQRLAYEEISSSNTGRGSAVAVDPQTGEVLAMASVPSYDPNNIDERFPELQEASNNPLVNRATQGLYVPGSAFKIITAAAGLKSGIEPSDEFFDDGSYIANGYRVTNFEGESYERVTFAKALAFSINTIFAEITVEEIGAGPLAQMARNFGYGDDYEDFALPVEPSTVGERPPSEWPDNYLAAAGFGQANVLTNTFEMAVTTGAIANDGVRMQPRLIQEVRSPEGIVLEQNAPSEKNRALEEKRAETLQKMMRRVVSDGIADEAQMKGVKVAGKTGTAEVGEGDPNSWFVAYAPAEDPEIAVAVLVENGGLGEDSALPVARKMIKSYVNGGGE